tara:strand:- start:3650 stop:4174 length:525 start_codon:yes stop_codon:yes gene_type:complete
MGHHIPQALLNHAVKPTIEVKLNTFTDRQLKNIVKAVRSGLEIKSTSATSMVSRQIMHMFNIPRIRLSWGSYHLANARPDHPIRNEIVKQCSLAKIAGGLSEWAIKDLEDALNTITKGESLGYFSAYYLSDQARASLRKSALSNNAITTDEVRDYLDELLKRKFDTITLDVTML